MTDTADTRPLTGAIPSDGSALGLAGYHRSGGYEGAAKALREMTPDGIRDEVTKAGLRGRGGAGFSTGRKWGFLPRQDGGQRYLVVNGDEMEPGTFKDRVLLEGNPHQLIEGMVISAFAIQASQAIIFLRGEYTLAAQRLAVALAEATDAGFVGGNLLGTGYDLEIQLHSSAGRYICGEETALLTSLEGKRAIPRAKPPFPQTSGLWGCPTVVNNVETLCNVPHIVRNGSAWYRSLSCGEDGGTKIYGVSGRVKRPGAWELPMGTTVREILEEHAGGMQDGYRLRGLLPGGASTEFLTADQLDVAMDFGSVEKAGSRLGTGTMIILDDRTCPVGMLLNLEHFFAQESCGWCTPCRDGLPWIERMLEAIENGEGRPEDLDLLAMHVDLLGPGKTFCALAPGAMEPLGSGLKHFRADFERHIAEGRCPWRQ